MEDRSPSLYDGAHVAHRTRLSAAREDSLMATRVGFIGLGGRAKWIVTGEDLPGAQIVAVAEDVGRHNAVDKVIGRLHLDGRLPAGDLGLFVSGRASFEMVQKACVGGFAALVSVSAPWE